MVQPARTIRLHPPTQTQKSPFYDSHLHTSCDDDAARVVSVRPALRHRGGWEVGEGSFETPRSVNRGASKHRANVQSDKRDKTSCATIEKKPARFARQWGLATTGKRSTGHWTLSLALHVLVLHTQFLLISHRITIIKTSCF